MGSTSVFKVDGQRSKGQVVATGDNNTSVWVDWSTEGNIIEVIVIQEEGDR